MGKPPRSARSPWCRIAWARPREPARAQARPGAVRAEGPARTGVRVAAVAPVRGRWRRMRAGPRFQTQGSVCSLDSPSFGTRSAGSFFDLVIGGGNTTHPPAGGRGGSEGKKPAREGKAGGSRGLNLLQNISLAHRFPPSTINPPP